MHYPSKTHNIITGKTANTTNGEDSGTILYKDPQERLRILLVN